ncbi:MAG: hypothetical protein J2O48_07740 [Solirubrobacterales bacterium]|nr:hypothetical protein [Solirubrobacterales bacterium]
MRSEPYLITPCSGRGVCPDCFNFMPNEAGRCRACGQNRSSLDAITPISYAPRGGRLHRELADYKRAADPSVPPVTLGLARILSRFLAAHERCIARAAGVERFDLVTTVPSADAIRDHRHPLRRIVGQLVPETAGRHQRVLLATNPPAPPHRYDADRFQASTNLDAANVLLIDDVWTTGAAAQSAATTLKRAGAAIVAAVVIGRYVNGWFADIADRLAQMEADYDPAACALCRGGRVGLLAA